MLLAGLGGSAHTYDDLAPRLTDSFRVIALTRRGTGESGRPSTGYDVSSRARDDLDVLDSLRVDSAYFVGHSIAGDELTELATRYPNRVAGVLYLDAAYDRSTMPSVGVSDPDMQVVHAPLIQTFDELLNFRRRSPLGLPPAMETDFWKTVRGEDGELVSSPPLPIMLAMIAESKRWHPDYAKIRAPTIAIYAFSLERPLTNVLLRPSDSVERQKSNELWRSEHWAWQNQEIARLVRGNPSAKVIVLNPADHLVYFSNSAAVLDAIRSLLPKSPR